MRQRKIGAFFLTGWAGLNFLVALAVTGLTLAGRPPPALRLLLPEAEISRVDPIALAVINAQALLVNPCIMALCALVLCLVWNGLRAPAGWMFWALALVLLPLQAFGFVSDGALGHRNLIANLVSSAVLMTGLWMSRSLLQNERPADSLSSRPGALTT